jgi:hypothetical protein
VRAVAAIAAAIAFTVLVATPAGAAPATTPRDPHPRIETVTVSNPAPTRDSAIDVFSRGWRPHRLVTIALADAELAHVRADASGAVYAEVTIPTDIRGGDELLSVTGASGSGVPQQIVTQLAVVADRQRPSPRPWSAICVVLALATLLLLVSQRVRGRETRLAP